MIISCQFYMSSIGSLWRSVQNLTNNTFKCLKNLAPSYLPDLIIQYTPTLTGLSLPVSAGCRRNSPVESKVIVGWILANDRPV